MEMIGLQCHGCGSTNVEFDPKRRILVCHQCGKEEYYSRATLNSNGKVVFGKQNAINFFLEGKFENAQHYAMEVLNISMDNAPSLYIMAYCDEYVLRKPDSLKQFFIQIKDVALEYEEVSDLRKMFIASAYNLMDYEENVIFLMAMNMQSEEEATELGEFIDRLCPYLISKRTSCGFLTDSLTEMYADLVEHCGIPKTCFALLKSIETNPDSPYVDHSFYLTSKCQYFYENYVLRIESILKKIADDELRRKFMASYTKKCETYKKDTGV